jgi:hypothetical protein
MQTRSSNEPFVEQIEHAGEGLCAQAGRAHQAFESLLDRRVVIDDVDHDRRKGHGRQSM